MTKCLILPHQARSKTKKGLSTLRKPRTSSEILQLNIGLPGCLLGKQRPWPQYWSVRVAPLACSSEQDCSRQNSYALDVSTAHPDPRSGNRVHDPKAVQYLSINQGPQGGRQTQNREAHQRPWREVSPLSFTFRTLDTVPTPLTKTG